MNKVYIILIIHLLSGALSAQVKDSLADLKGNGDSLVLSGEQLFVVSPDSIQEPVDYGADEKVRFDYGRKIIHLYGNAFIKYKTMDIKADYIRVELDKNLAIAEPKVDSAGNRTGIPKFTEGRQTFDAQKISYNFSTRKGMIEEILTKESDLFIHGTKTKFVSHLSKDSNGDDIIYNQNAIITTCDAEHPHYGIYSKKQKIIPDKLAVVGPSYVQIQGIPTPLWIPFGFFPISKKARAGILFPKEYTYDDRGFGLTNIGYFLPVSDYLNLKFIGDIFFKGSFKLGIVGNYKKKYKYNGSFELQFENRIQELPESYLTDVNRPISLRWSHNQEQGAHPYRNFGGSMNIETKGFSKLQYRNYSNALQNVLRSNLKYNFTIPNSPWSISTAMSHSQNLITKQVDITLPEVSVQMRSINPFKRKKIVGGSQKWYERVSLNYNAQFRNSANTTDSLLFSDQIFDQLRYGFRHGFDLNANFKILKYFNVTPNISYDEELSFFSQDIRLLDTIFKNPNDTTMTIYGKLDTMVNARISSFRTISAGASVSTQIYGQLLSSKGWFRGIRHQLTPSVSFNFSPDYHKAPFEYFRQYDTDLRPEFNTVREYLPYTKSPFGQLSVPGENLNINFNIANTLELKYYSKGDSSFKKIPLIKNFNLSARYSVFADSFKLSFINGSGSNRFLNGILSMYYGLTFDPYGRELIAGKEIRTKTFAIDQNRRLVYLTSAFLNTTASASFEQIFNLFKKKKSATSNDQLPALHDLFKSFSLNYILNYRYNRTETGSDTLIKAVDNISIRGFIPLTKNWRINIDNVSYDFNNKSLQYPSLGLERDLHCWIMRFDWSPQFGYYSFFIGVKPGSLEFLRIPSNQSFSGARR